jgi:uncharacterized protein YkwD
MEVRGRLGPLKPRPATQTSRSLMFAFSSLVPSHRHACRAGALFLALGLAGCGMLPGREPDSVSAPPVSAVRLDPSEIAKRISAYRETHNLTPVTIDPGLMQFAQAQANAMARADHLSHEVAGSFSQRLDAANRRKATAVENVSAGYATADAVFGGWQRSPPHNANLLASHMHRMGIATADAPGTRYKTYWALVMTD